MTKKSIKKRKVDLIVISDIHLGTYGCHAKELLNLYKWGPHFLVLNRQPLKDYSAAKNSKEVIEVMNQYI